MKADPSAQLKLLDVAGLDARIDLLHHQLAGLPEHEEIAGLTSARAGLSDRLRDARIVADDLAREQRKADADVEQVRARRERDRTRMDSGQISNPKDLERMTHELASLEKRINDLEDVELEVMEQLEEAQRDLERLADELAHTEKRLEESTVRRDQRSVGIEEDLTRVRDERAAVAGDLPEDLVALYERIRASKGVGAAELRARQCGGCRLTLNAADLAVISKAAPDEVVRCEECSRILVRTPESGLAK